MPNHWLLKTEPSAYSFAQLEKDGKTTWDGVKNSLALKHLASVRKGDLLFVYHSGDEKTVVGVARALCDAYPDPKQKDPKLLVVDLEPVKRLRRSVPLSEIKGSPRFSGFDLVRLPRLSVIPVTAEHAAEIEKMAKA